MSRTKGSATTRTGAAKPRVLQERLKLIKQRHWELILRPREQVFDNFPPDEDEEACSVDETEERQLLEDYSMEP